MTNKDRPMNCQPGLAWQSLCLFSVLSHFSHFTFTCLLVLSLPPFIYC